jgi:hypothetical protein
LQIVGVLKMNAQADKENRVTNLVLDEKFKDGEFVESGDHVQSDSFWAGVEVLTYQHQHLRVAELKGQIEYQYKISGGRLYLRTLRYHLTSRPSNKYWYRANIDVQIEGYSTQRVNSPDAMSQNAQWHQYIVNLEVAYAPEIRAGLKIRIEYDGTNNGVGERDSWGNVVTLIPR